MELCDGGGSLLLGLFSVGIMGTSVGWEMARVIPWVGLCGICWAIMDTDGSLCVIGMFLASSAVAGRTCSGAHRYSLLDWVVQIVWEFSCLQFSWDLPRNPLETLSLGAST